MNQHNWMRYGCYDRAREDSNKMEILFGQNVGGKANNCVSLASLLWWLSNVGQITMKPVD